MKSQNVSVDCVSKIQLGYFKASVLRYIIMEVVPRIFIIFGSYIFRLLCPNYCSVSPGSAGFLPGNHGMLAVFHSEGWSHVTRCLSQADPSWGLCVGTSR